MKAAITILFAIATLSACTHQSYQEVSSTRQQEINREVDKTDYAKIASSDKDRIEKKRQERYHQVAEKTDKKYNRVDKSQLNQRKVWDGTFGLY